MALPTWCWEEIGRRSLNLSRNVAEQGRVWLGASRETLGRSQKHGDSSAISLAGRDRWFKRAKCVTRNPADRVAGSDPRRRETGKSRETESGVKAGVEDGRWGLGWISDDGSISSLESFEST